MQVVTDVLHPSVNSTVPTTCDFSNKTFVPSPTKGCVPVPDCDAVMGQRECVYKPDPAIYVGTWMDNQLQELDDRAHVVVGAAVAAVLLDVMMWSQLRGGAALFVYEMCWEDDGRCVPTPGGAGSADTGGFPGLDVSLRVR